MQRLDVNSIWLAPSEMAGLPKLPTTDRRTRDKADREQWESRDRTGRGGGKEYRLPDRYLTPEMIAALQEKFYQKGLKSADPDAFNDLLDGLDNLSTIVDGKKCLTKAGGLSDEAGDAISQPISTTVGGSLLSTIVDTPKEELLATEFRPLPNEDKETLGVWARLEIVRRWQLYIKDADVGELEASTRFCRDLANGAIAVPDWVRDGLRTKDGKLKVSRASLQNWKGKTAGDLQPKYKGKAESFFDQRPEYCVAAEALLREFGASPTRIHYAFRSGIIADDFGLEEVPSYSQILRWLQGLDRDNHQRQRAFATGDKSVLLSAQGSYSRGLKPNDRWEVDSTKSDATAKRESFIWLASPYQETAVRCALVVAIDVATRMVKILVRPTSNGEAICLVLADCVRDWGLPKVVKTDNGKDYIGKHVHGFLVALGAEQKLCVVKQPWQKPHIERFMRTLQHSPEWEMLPWNTGHNVAQQQALRKKREGDLMLPWTMERFQSWCNAWVDAYHNRLHEGLGCSPIERLAAFRAENWIALMPKKLEENLAFALMQEDLVTVGKQGIRYQNRFYLAPEMQGRVGEKVSIRIDQADPNQIYVYSGGFDSAQPASLICIAKWDMALTPEEQARIASVKPVIDQARADHEAAIKKAQRKLKGSIAKNPEKLLPERGGVVAMRATAEIELATERLIAQIGEAVSTSHPQLSEAKRGELDEIRRELEANDKKVVSIAINYDDLLQGVVKAWQKQQPISDGDLLEAAHYCEQPEGQGALICFLERDQYRVFLRWIANKKATLQVAI